MRFSDEHLQTILRGAAAVGRAPYPGLEGEGVEIGVRILSEAELDDARLDAQLHLKRFFGRVNIDPVKALHIDPEHLDAEQRRQILLRAVVDPDSHKPFFAAAAEVRGLPSHVVGQLWAAYLDWIDAVDPRIRLDPAAVDELAAALKKEPSAKVILAHYGPDTLSSLARTLAAQRSS